MDNNKPSRFDNEEEKQNSLQEEKEIQQGSEPATESESQLELQSEVQPVTEVETQPEAATDPEMQKDQAENEEQPAAKGKNSVVWMVISGVLAAALIIVLIYPPFGGGKEAVASVNGTDISKDELYNELVTLGGQATLENMITMELVDQAATDANVTVTEEDVNAELETLKTQYGGEEAFNSALAQSGMTLDALKKNMDLQVKMRKILEPQTEVTDEQISTYYEENKASFATPEQVKASHILVETKEEADAIKKELDGGADFATLAKEKSTDTASAANGGDLGFFGEADMVEPFSKAAFSMEINEISDPVQSDYGYHIIMKTDHKEATNPTLEDKKEEIRTILVDQQIGELSSTWMTDLRSNAEISNTLTPAEESTDAATESTDSTEDTGATTNE
ncbi:peptidylprolyl isomerase [Paenibacillus urinalis]|uniref:Peptidylprolyl isomerase n=1 Tax=Paenibacillus urinalis TaxID=521520 RepID=A0ABY7XBS6_9BACL|nr:peptidylprolyl isomerase [Paenibacillus urinalis]WDH99595.1 peptidylprolyl isomerase [Paenibacillus urinalis]WDI03229.1 peptidylprolyl isomerase [Paenibacillus urinalis]